MSFDTSVECEHCESYLGGYSGNYTYNLSPMFYWAIDSEDGLRKLNGMRGKEAGELLTKAISKCEKKGDKLSRFNPPNGWGDYKSAIGFLNELKKVAMEYPEGIVRVS